MIDQKRRTVLKATLAGGALAGAGLLLPGRLLAAGPEDAFMAATLQDALNALYADARGIPASLDGTQTDAISFEDTKESPANSRSVPISVSSKVPNTEFISIFIENNPRPLVARFRFEPGAVPTVHIRAKMHETSRVIAVIEDTAGRRYSRAMKIAVAESGCAV